MIDILPDIDPKPKPFLPPDEYEEEE